MASLEAVRKLDLSFSSSLTEMTRGPPKRGRAASLWEVRYSNSFASLRSREAPARSPGGLGGQGATSGARC